MIDRVLHLSRLFLPNHQCKKMQFLEWAEVQDACVISINTHLYLPLVLTYLWQVIVGFILYFLIVITFWLSKLCALPIQHLVRGVVEHRPQRVQHLSVVLEALRLNAGLAPGAHRDGWIVQHWVEYLDVWTIFYLQLSRWVYALLWIMYGRCRSYRSSWFREHVCSLKILLYV